MAQAPAQQQPSMLRRYWGFSGPPVAAEQQPPPQPTSPVRPPQDIPRVPWPEVNAALGYTALLLHRLSTVGRLPLTNATMA